MYNPTVGRFLEEDPIQFQAGDTDLYRYVANRPTTGTDPTGLDQPPQGLTVQPTDSGLKMTYNGQANFQVQQWMQVELYPRYKCQKVENGVPCFEIKEGNGVVVSDLNEYAPQWQRPDPGHGHPHPTGVPNNPKPQPDMGGNDFYPIAQPGTYVDTPNLPLLWYDVGLSAIKKNAKPPAGCELIGARLLQRFVTVIYLNGLLSWAVYWTATSEKEGSMTINILKEWNGQLGDGCNPAKEGLRYAREVILGEPKPVSQEVLNKKGLD